MGGRTGYGGNDGGNSGTNGSNNRPDSIRVNG